ncbi:MAG TPA: hypothetical protein VJ835_11760 [Fimbriimonadaceae bacterium]|nr:hypothetical protein [Fimbriimonadaceae bacterium]
MYMVISKWEFDPASEGVVKDKARRMMQQIRAWDGVESAFNVRTSPGSVLAVIGYRDEATYQRLIQDPNGPFEKAAQESGIEQEAQWKWSERGEVEEA